MTSQRKRIALSTRYLPQDACAPVADRYEIVMPDEEKNRFSREELLSYLPDCELLICAGNYPLPAEVLSAGSMLRAVANCGVGYDHIDVACASEHGIAVINSPRSVCNPTAELVLSLILSLVRGIVRWDRDLRISRRCGTPLFFDRDMTLEGKTLGIIGMGSIGRRVAQMAAAFGMTICYHNRNRLSPETEAEYRASYRTLDELLAVSDVVSLNLPMTPESYHLINADRISNMKPGAYLINAARGAVVEERALIDALKNGTIRGAALDVFEFEPEISEEMAALENIVITPHIGTAVRESRIRMMHEALRGACEYLDGGMPENLVNREGLS